MIRADCKEDKGVGPLLYEDAGMRHKVIIQG